MTKTKTLYEKDEVEALMTVRDELVSLHDQVRNLDILHYQSHDILKTIGSISLHVGYVMGKVGSLGVGGYPYAWEPKEKYEMHGTHVIGWVATDKGFSDTTAQLYYVGELKAGGYCNKVGWYWDYTDEYVKHQDMILGVIPWPKPPVKNKRACNPEGINGAAENDQSTAKTGVTE